MFVGWADMVGIRRARVMVRKAMSRLRPGGGLCVGMLAVEDMEASSCAGVSIIVA